MNTKSLEPMLKSVGFAESEMPRCDPCSVNSDGLKEIIGTLIDGFIKTSLPLNTEVSC